MSTPPTATNNSFSPRLQPRTGTDSNSSASHAITPAVTAREADSRALALPNEIYAKIFLLCVGPDLHAGTARSIQRLVRNLSLVCRQAKQLFVQTRALSEAQKLAFGEYRSSALSDWHLRTRPSGTGSLDALNASTLDKILDCNPIVDFRNIRKDILHALLARDFHRFSFDTLLLTDLKNNPGDFQVMTHQEWAKFTGFLARHKSHPDRPSIQLSLNDGEHNSTVLKLYPLAQALAEYGRGTINLTLEITPHSKLEALPSAFSTGVLRMLELKCEFQSNFPQVPSLLEVCERALGDCSSLESLYLTASIEQTSALCAQAGGNTRLHTLDIHVLGFVSIEQLGELTACVGKFPQLRVFKLLQHWAGKQELAPLLNALRTAHPDVTINIGRAGSEEPMPLEAVDLEEEDRQQMVAARIDDFNHLFHADGQMPLLEELILGTAAFYSEVGPYIDSDEDDSSTGPDHR